MAGMPQKVSRTVKCVLLGVEAEGLDYAPYPGELGQRIYENVSFLKPAKLGRFTATSRLVTRDERNAETAGELRDEDGLLVATTTARLRIVWRKG